MAPNPSRVAAMAWLRQIPLLSRLLLAQSIFSHPTAIAIKYAMVSSQISSHL
jgi:hypothetical protein